MYAKHFGLTEDPFRVTPDRRFLFFGDVHGPVISKLRSWVVRPHGLCLLAGAPGVGKTLALRQVVAMLPEDTPVSFLFNAHLDFRGFLSAVLTDFGVDLEPNLATEDLLREVHSFVGLCRASGRRPVVIVDEAGNLMPEVAAQLKALVNVPSVEAQGLSLVLGCDVAHRDRLVGMLGGDAILTEITLSPLRRDEVVKYLEHRMRAAGWRDGAFFYEAALERIAEVSGGVPRLINTVAGKALLLAYLGGDQIVAVSSVEEAALELWTAAKTKSSKPVGGSMLEARLQAQSVSAEVEGAAETLGEEALKGSSPVPLRESPSSVLEGVAKDPSFQQPSVESCPEVLTGASPSRRYAFLIAFSCAAALFTVKMSTEQGQREVIETAEPVIENVGRMAGELRELVASADPEHPREEAHVDWTPPPRPVPVVTRSARYASLRGAAVSADVTTAAMAGERVPQLSLADLRTVPPPSAVAAAEGERAARVRLDQQLRVRALMKSAGEHVNAGRYTEPDGANALEAYSEVLALEPDHGGARRGMRSIAFRLERRGRAAEDQEDWESATEYYRRALSIDSGSTELRAALERSLIATTTGGLSSGD